MISSSLVFVLLASSASNGAFSFVTPSQVALKKAPYLKFTTTRLQQTYSPPASSEPAVMPLETKSPPMIIQGGMGVRISSWKLAREVSKKGGLGVISGTAMDVVFLRTLQDGDPGGHFRRALATFPNQAMVQSFLGKYYIEGKSPTKPYRSLPLWTISPSCQLEEAAILGNYCEVWLAKHHDDGSPTGGLVGINRLTKVQLPTIHSLYGAMLADVDYVIMGAGIPSRIPGILDALAEHRECSLPIEVRGEDAENNEYAIKFSPNQFWKGSGTSDLAKKRLRRPYFLPIVSSTTLAQSLLKRSNGAGPTRGINGFVVELSPAGGHNAPPRGWHYEPSDQEEPVYGKKDSVDIEKFAKVSKGLPFWFAGSYGKKEKLVDVLHAGGTGVQVGTLFALSNESGMNSSMKQTILSKLAEGEELKVITDPAASPTGFPFKVLDLGDSAATLSDSTVYNARPRVCNLGYLRYPYIQSDGKVGYRCPSEPVDSFVSKGGDADETSGRKCLCNALCADAGFPQIRQVTNPLTGDKDLYVEPPLVTVGDDVNQCATLIKKNVDDGTYGYSASDVVDYLMSDWKKNQRKAKRNAAKLDPHKFGYDMTKLDEYLMSEYEKSQRKAEKERDRMSPHRFGYDMVELDEYLLSEWDVYHKQTRQDDPTLLSTH